MPQSASSVSPASIRWIFLFLGLLIGGLLGWPLLSGNERGQVNLLAVLMLLALLPLLTLLLSLAALLRRRDTGIRLLWQALPLPARWKQQLHRLRVSGESFWWLFYAGQWMGVGFSLGNLGAFGLLLLFTDLHFVWRSTLLNAEQVRPWLEILASPWRFWEAAQPSLQQLQASRNERIGSGLSVTGLGDWWRFLLAAQLCYALLPRLAMAFWASRHLQLKRRHGTATQTSSRDEANSDLPQPVRTLPDDAVWFDAAWLPPAIASRLPQSPCAIDQQDLPTDRPLIVVVRAWEPPLGELADRLEGHRGLLLPLDWEGGELRPPRPAHLDEWRRFAASLDGSSNSWGVLQWSPKDDG